MDARNRRKCFTERSFSHDILRDNLSSTQKEDIPSSKEKFFAASSETVSTLTRSGFRGKLARTDSSIIVISRCAGNSSSTSSKPNQSKKKAKPVRQNSLSSFFQKHFGSSNHQRRSEEKEQKLHIHSKKAAGFASSSVPSIPTKTVNISGYVEKRNISPVTSPHLLGVPNIFTTAFSRSPRFAGGADVSPDDIRLTEHSDCESGIKKECSKSTPELQDFNTDNSERVLDPTRRERRSSDDVSQNVTSLLRGNRYKDTNVCEILDYLYMGSIEAAYNEPLLCKLGIDSLIDISNIPAEKVPYHKKSDCPCMCTSRTRHLRAKLYVAVDDHPSENIQQYFSEINSFIEGVKRCEKRVLIYSYHGNSRAPTAVIQHLMSQQNLLLRQSFNLVKNQRPSIKLNPGFRTTLECLERTLFPGAKPSLSFENEFVNVANPQLVKTAWADC